MWRRSKAHWMHHPSFSITPSKEWLPRRMSVWRSSCTRRDSSVTSCAALHAYPFMKKTWRHSTNQKTGQKKTELHGWNAEWVTITAMTVFLFDCSDKFDNSWFHSFRMIWDRHLPISHEEWQWHHHGQQEWDHNHHASSQDPTDALRMIIYLWMVTVTSACILLKTSCMLSMPVSSW